MSGKTKKIPALKNVSLCALAFALGWSLFPAHSVRGQDTQSTSSSSSAKSRKKGRKSTADTGATQSATTPPSTPAPANSRSTRSSAASTEQAPPPSGSGMVWVNTETKVYHRQGDRWYGKTKNGKYMSESDAIKAGYHLSHEKGKH